MEIYSAPLQGYTEARWRNLHNEIFGGIDCYFTPFIRYEHGEIRSKDIRDVERKNNTAENLVPQIIAATPEEMRPLVQFIKSEGYRRIDINMGCSFPLQARKRHGAGILPFPGMVAALMDEATNHPDVSFSVKMRLGWDNKNEWEALIDILNAAPLSHITMHPRLGREQYKQPADIEAFARFYEKCGHPLIYNGDITTLDNIKRIEAQFPRLQGIMVGRGLLSNPALGSEYKQGKLLSRDELRSLVHSMHEAMFRSMSSSLQGNTQLLSKLKPYWEYLLPEIEKRHRKAILKATTADKYQQAVNVALASFQ
ncbi:MAG: tRNA-dihydrouridine synthase family protein [Bacteroidaceae bacterium]|nr:tRNA-dihydrouridine synthase family protein [Bacteroidaceae bacterium]